MRLRSSRRVIAIALTAAGVSAAVFGVSSSATAAPPPRVDGLIAKTQSLGNLGSVLAPVTDVLNMVLKADQGQLTPEQVAAQVDAVRKAVDKVTEGAPNSVKQDGMKLVDECKKLTKDATSGSPAAEAKDADKIIDHAVKLVTDEARTIG